jgi:glycosyltransferase involved in cell wall biosynthesis
MPIQGDIAFISLQGDTVAPTGSATCDRPIDVYYIAETLSKLGWRVSLLLRKVEANQPTIVQRSPRCRVIRLAAGPLQEIPRDRLFAYLPEFVQAICHFLEQTATTFCLSHTTDWLSGWVGLQLQQMKNIPQVHSFPSLDALKYRTIDAIGHTMLQPTPTQQIIEQKLLAQATCLTVNSPCEYQEMRSLLPHNFTTVIPWGIDIQRFRPLPKHVARKQLGLALADQIVLYAGQLGNNQDVVTFLRACALLKQGFSGASLPVNSRTLPPFNLRLMLIPGHGSETLPRIEQQQLEDVIRRLGLTKHVLLINSVDQQTLPSYYSAANVCVIPGEDVSSNLTAIEAMACGVPVVASSVGKLQYTVIPEKTGLLVPPRETEAFAGAIARFLRNPNWAIAMGQNGVHYIQHYFSWSSVALRLSQLYQRLIQNTAQVSSDQVPSSFLTHSKVLKPHPHRPTKATTSLR